MSLTTSILQGGTNSHATSSEEANAFGTDFAAEGVVGTLGNTGGVAPTTGNFSVNAQGTPDMTVAVGTGVAYVTGTPTSGNSQLLRVKNSASANVTISANTTGGTRYDWLYLKLDPDKMKDPASDASDVATLVTSRSTSASTDNGTPPTYGIILAVVTVINGASSISNGSITDKRSQAVTTSTTYTPYFALYNFIETGCVWTADSAGSTLNGTMTTGYVWIGGKRLLVPTVTAHAFTASKDTYVDLQDSGDGVNATVNYTEVTNNAASPALYNSGTTNNTVRCAIIVTGASSIAAAASINQGQETRVLPIASSIPYAVTDSLGNLICPRDPQRKILGYRQIASDFATSSTTAVQVTGLSCPVIVPTGRKIKITAHTGGFFNGTAGNGAILSVWDGVVASGTQLGQSNGILNTNSASPGVAVAINTPSSTTKTFNAGAKSISAGTTTVQASSTGPAFIIVELF